MAFSRAGFTAERIIQFVCFETALPCSAFLPRWEPFASSFLSRGLERIVLGEQCYGRTDGFGFVSRNTWPASSFRSVFRGQLPGTVGGGGVTAVQAGGFRVVACVGVDHVAPVESTVVKTLALVRCSESSLDSLFQKLSELTTLLIDGIIGWTIYCSDRETQGGRFNAAFEVYCTDEVSAVRVYDTVAASLHVLSVEEVRLQTLRDVMALP